MKKKAIFTAIIIIAVLLTAYFGYAIWFHNMIIDRYASKLEYNKDEKSYMEDIGGLHYYVYVPNWWTIGSANIDVSTDMVMDGIGNIIREGFFASAYISSFSKKPVLDLRLYCLNDEGKVETIAVYVDEKGRLIDEENISALTREIYEKNKDAVERVLSLYRDMWGMFEN